MANGIADWRNGRRNDGMAEWQNSRMSEWRNGRMAEWQNDRMAEWQNGRMAEWQNGGNGGRNGHTFSLTCAQNVEDYCVGVWIVWEDK